MFASVILLSQPYGALTYALPEYFPRDFFSPGMRVAVPLGGMIRSGYIERIMPEAKLPENVKCRPIIWPLEKEPSLTEGLMDLARDLSLRQGVEPGRVFGYILPSGLRSCSVEIDWNGQKWDLAAIRKLDEASKSILARDYLAGHARMGQPKAPDLDEQIIGLNCDPPWPVRPGAKRQITLLDFLFERGAVSRAQIRKALGAGTRQTLESMLAGGLVRVLAEDESIQATGAKPVELNDEQREALKDLVEALNSGTPQNRLLYGVTGSGKTAVYMRLVEECLKQGKSAFLLAPEVALAHKLFADAKAALPDAPILLYHGYQLPRAREKSFLAVKKSPCLIIGTRSALFLPAPNPGCVILDEEHDGSFKQDESFAYHAREVAWFRMQTHKGLLLLGSATPDLKTFYASSQGGLPLLRLKRRASGNELPPVELVDIGKMSGRIQPGTLKASDAGLGLLSPYVEEALQNCARAGEQAVILLNRRGYAPMMYCASCASVLHCPHCEIGLAWHKSTQKLVCHYCGYSLPWPSPCPECHNMNFLPIGEGTEKIGERLENLCGEQVLRLDRDNVRRQGRIDEILGAFRKGESPFLVGTQMLSKGHHFPNVTLVVVADGDIGLNLPDYRAAERTFQLLVQSGGRAGRGEKPGRVLIQTRDVNHYCWQFVAKSDYDGFYAAELARRKKRLYPPFTRLGLLRISFDQKDELAREALAAIRDPLAKKARELGVRLLGPAPSPIAMLRGKMRFQCLVKSQEWAPIRALYFFVLSLKASGRLKFFLDLDPVNML